MSKSGIIYSSTRLTNKKPQNRTLIFADVHSAAKPQPNNQPNWGCLKSLMNVPFANYPVLDYTMSKLMQKIGFNSKIKDQTPIPSPFSMH